MASITFDRFDGGLDIRKGASVSDANRMRVCTNAYITTGKGIQKRPCLRKIATLETGTTGLRAGGGVLNTFFGSGSVTHANTLFKPSLVRHPTLSQAVSKIHYGDIFNGFLYIAVEYVDGSVWHHYLNDVGVWVTVTTYTKGNLRRPTILNTFNYEVIDVSIGVSIWVTATAYTVGTFRKPIVSNTLRYEVTAIAGTGTSGAVEPIWPLTAGLTVIDNPGANQITWTCRATNASGAVEPVWPLTLGVTINDGGLQWRTVSTNVSDVNCPQTRQVIKQQSKIYAKGTEVVRFCATNAPRDWTSVSDAGFLATGIQAQGSTDVTALGQFSRTKMVVFTIDGIQVWNVDPNPALNSLDNIIPNIGTRYAKSPLGFSGDIFFLSESGFRSLTVSQLTDNFNDVDIGSSIDSLIKDSILVNDDPQSIFYSGLGQFWSINKTDIWVYSFSRTSKLSAWSRFNINVIADSHAVLNGELYIRNGNDVFIVDRKVFSDDGMVPTVTVEFPFLDFKAPGVLKQLFAVDSIGAGNATLQLKYLIMVNNVPTEFITSPVPIILGNTTIPGPLTPIELCATAVAPVIKHAANEDFRLDSITFYYESLGFNV